MTTPSAPSVDLDTLRAHVVVHHGAEEAYIQVLDLHELVQQHGEDHEAGGRDHLHPTMPTVFDGFVPTLGTPDEAEDEPDVEAGPALIHLRVAVHSSAGPLIDLNAGFASAWMASSLLRDLGDRMADYLEAQEADRARR